MDPLSIAVGSLQVVSLCAQSTVALAQWIGDVKNVDERIDAPIRDFLARSQQDGKLDRDLRRGPGPFPCSSGGFDAKH